MHAGHDMTERRGELAATRLDDVVRMQIMCAPADEQAVRPSGVRCHHALCSFAPLRCEAPLNLHLVLAVQ